MQNVGLKKIKKGRLKKFNYNSNLLKFGSLGLKTIESGILNFKQIEASKLIIIKTTKYKCKIWVKNSSLLPIFSKPIGIRMGKGKGKFINFVIRVNAGSIIFELSGFSQKLLIKSLLACKFKLPLKTKICFKTDI